MLKENINEIVAKDEIKSKFKPNWFDPYVVVDEIGLGVYILSSMYGKKEPNTFDAIHLKCFYA